MPYMPTAWIHTWKGQSSPQSSGMSHLAAQGSVLSLAWHYSLKIPPSQKVYFVCVWLLLSKKVSNSFSQEQMSILGTVCLSCPQGPRQYHYPAAYRVSDSQAAPHNAASVIQMYPGLLLITYGKTHRQENQMQEGRSLETDLFPSLSHRRGTGLIRGQKRTEGRAQSLYWGI